MNRFPGFRCRRSGMGSSPRWPMSPRRQAEQHRSRESSHPSRVSMQEKCPRPADIVLTFCSGTTISSDEAELNMTAAAHRRFSGDGGIPLEYIRLPTEELIEPSLHHCYVVLVPLGAGRITVWTTRRRCCVVTTSTNRWNHERKSVCCAG